MEAINFLKPLISLLCKKITKRKESMKACEIYKKDKELKIVTMYETDTGLFLSNEPIFILPVNSSKEELLNAILRAISASKLIKYTTDYSSKSLLHKLKEKNFKSLYLSSVSCFLYIDGNNAEIKPQQFSNKLKCLVTNKSREVYIKNFTRENLIMEISKILELEMSEPGN